MLRGPLQCCCLRICSHSLGSQGLSQAKCFDEVRGQGARTQRAGSEKREKEEEPKGGG